LPRSLRRNLWQCTQEIAFETPMINLNLPAFPYKIKKEDDKIWIFDVLRKKYVILTPEEWVRQHFVNYLMVDLVYPRALIKIEGGLTYNQLQKRSDIVVFDREGKPWMIVECKAADFKLSPQTLRQVSAYNATLKAKYLVITNGLSHFYFEIDWVNGKTSSLEKMPSYLP
jgi:hypothetical protein